MAVENASFAVGAEVVGWRNNKTSHSGFVWFGFSLGGAHLFASGHTQQDSGSLVALEIMLKPPTCKSCAPPLEPALQPSPSILRKLTHETLLPQGGRKLGLSGMNATLQEFTSSYHIQHFSFSEAAFLPPLASFSHLMFFCWQVPVMQ